MESGLRKDRRLERGEGRCVSCVRVNLLLCVIGAGSMCGDGMGASGGRGPEKIKMEKVEIVGGTS